MPTILPQLSATCGWLAIWLSATHARQARKPDATERPLIAPALVPASKVKVAGTAFTGASLTAEMVKVIVCALSVPPLPSDRLKPNVSLAPSPPACT